MHRYIGGNIYNLFVRALESSRTAQMSQRTPYKTIRTTFVSVLAKQYDSCFWYFYIAE